MKTIQQLKNRRDELLKELGKIQDKNTQDRKDRMKIKKIHKELELIKLCVRYLETNPDPDFVKSELARIERTIKILSGRFSIWAKQPENKKVEPRKAKGIYEKQVDMKGFQNRLNTMRFLLS